MPAAHLATAMLKLHCSSLPGRHHRISEAISGQHAVGSVRLTQHTTPNSPFNFEQHLNN